MAFIMVRCVPSILTLVRVFIMNGCWTLSNAFFASIEMIAFSDINLTNVFFGQSPKATEIKAKINQWDLIKLTCFCTPKETKKKTKRQLTEWEKIASTDATDKSLISKIYKQLIQLNSKKSQQPNWKMGKRTKQTLLQGRCTDGQQEHEKMLNIPDY